METSSNQNQQIVPVHQRVAVQVQAPDAMTLAQQFAKSGFFADIRDAAQALVKIEYGRELGVGPAAAMMGVHIIQGKPSPSAGLMAALIKGSGKYNYRVKQWDNTACVLEFIENGQSVGLSSFTMQDAATAGATGGKNSHTWKAYPRNMLFARALSNGARIYCPDVFLGPVYTAEELGVAVNEDGEIVEGQAHDVTSEPIRIHDGLRRKVEVISEPDAPQIPAERDLNKWVTGRLNELSAYLSKHELEQFRQGLWGEKLYRDMEHEERYEAWKKLEPFDVPAKVTEFLTEERGKAAIRSTGEQYPDLELFAGPPEAEGDSK